VNLRSPTVLRYHIAAAGLTYRELAHQAGIAHATLANLCRPEGRQRCSAETARRIAFALDLAPSDLFLSDIPVIHEPASTPGVQSPPSREST